MITELGDGNERMSEAGEFMGLAGTKGKSGMDNLTRVCGLYPLFVG